MSTNSYIAVKTAEGYKTIYCHHDGYPEYMYHMLNDWYNTEERALALVSFGDASSIDRLLEPTSDFHKFGTPEPDVCMFYHRDRGESWEHTQPAMFTKEEVLNGQYYCYIFEDEAWHVYINRKEAYDYSEF